MNLVSNDSPVSLSSNNDGGMDWGSLILLGNDVAMQWYSMTQDREMPDPQLIPGTNIPTRSYNNTLIMIGLVAVAAILIFRKS